MLRSTGHALGNGPEGRATSGALSLAPESGDEWRIILEMVPSVSALVALILPSPRVAMRVTQL